MSHNIPTLWAKLPDMENTIQDFTKGNITGKLVRFMLPVLGALVLQAAYGAVDVLMVGWFGTILQTISEAGTRKGQEGQSVLQFSSF